MASPDRDRGDALSVPEMLRIMDVASALRLDRELVEEQLNLDGLKGRLRERMIAASRVTGEEVSAEEVEAAIDTYYARLHTFREPEMSLPVALAHLWVRRRPILIAAGSGLGALALGWWLFLSASGPLSASGRLRRRVDRLNASVGRREAAILAVSRDPGVAAEVDRLKAEARAYADQGDPEKLAEVDATAAKIEARLLEEYTVSVVSAPGRKSGVDRLMPEEGGRRVSGYYLIVEARGPGYVIPRPIRNRETGRDEVVESWGERVPREVFDRLAEDKKSDGILDETAFAVKRRGELDEEVVIRGGDGRPLTRLGQITTW